MPYIDKSELLNGIYSDNPTDVMLYIARFPTADVPERNVEKLTDSEQRIFLAAIGREEKVCKEVDELWRDSREPYEDSLVRVCREIERKVKKALWTN